MLEPYPFGFYKDEPGCRIFTTFKEGGYVDKEITNLAALSRSRRERME